MESATPQLSRGQQLILEEMVDSLIKSHVLKACIQNKIIPPTQEAFDKWFINEVMVNESESGNSVRFVTKGKDNKDIVLLHIKMEELLKEATTLIEGKSMLGQWTKQFGAVRANEMVDQMMNYQKQEDERIEREYKSGTLKGF